MSAAPADRYRRTPRTDLVGVRLRPEETEAIREAALREDCTVPELIRRAVRRDLQIA